MMQASAVTAGAMVASLRQIMPPTALVHIGAGRGTGAMHQWRDWNVPTAWLVDAEPAQLAWTERLAALHPGWQVRAAMLADADGEAPYFRASNPAESGLVPTSKLTALWPNLREGEQGQRATTRLDTLLTGSARLPEDATCWLIVDCLPALRILQGAPETLERCSVLWLRTLLQPLPESEAGTTLDELQAFLAPLGFRCVQLTESNHPALGEALFVRDWAQRLQPVIAELQESNAQRAQQNQDLQSRLAAQENAAKASVQERDAQAELALARQAQLGKLDAEKAALAAQLASQERHGAELANKITILEKENAAKAGALAAAQTAAKAQAEALTKEKDALASTLQAQEKAHADLKNTLATREKELSSTAEALKTAQVALANRTGERDALAKEKDALSSKLAALAKEKSDVSDKLAAEAKRYTLLADKHAKLEMEHATVTDALHAVQAELATRTGERDKQAAMAAERQAKFDALLQEKAALATKLDTQAKTYAALADRFAALEKEQGMTAESFKAAQAALAARTGERDAQTTLAAERQAKLDALDKEKTALVDKLAAANTTKQEFAKRNDTLQGEVSQLSKARDEQAKLASERSTQLSQTTGQRDNLSKENHSLKSEVLAKDDAITKLNGQLAEQDQRSRELNEKIDALAKEKNELAINLDVKWKTQAELAAKHASLEKEHANKGDALKAAQADVAKRSDEREAQARLAGERQAKLDALGKEKTALADKLAAAEGARQELAKRSDTLQGQVDQLTKARDEQAKLASDRAAQLTQLTSQRDSLSKESQSLKSEAQAKDAAIAKLHEQITEQDHRERQLVEEIVRAEAQIDLIKDLLLREGGL